MAGTDQTPGDPFIEHPNEVKVEKDDGAVMTFCWRDHDRVCTGGCEAFDPMYADDDTGRWTSCRMLNLGIALGAAATHFLRSNTPSRESVPGVNIKAPEVV